MFIFPARGGHMDACAPHRFFPAAAEFAVFFSPHGLYRIQVAFYENCKCGKSA